MDARTIALIQRSFDKVRASASEPAGIFYEELFAIDPSLRSMFGGDMQVQQRKFLSALNYIVYALAAPEKILGSVQKLAQVHVGYGVTPDHYTSFGNGLLRMLKRTLGAEFTADLCDAWSQAFRTIAEIMKEAGCSGASVTACSPDIFKAEATLSFFP